VEDRDRGRALAPRRGARRRREAEELFGKLQPFKELVADDIRDDDGEDDTA